MAYYLRIELKDRGCSDLLEHPETAYAKVFVEEWFVSKQRHMLALYLLRKAQNLT